MALQRFFVCSRWANSRLPKNGLFRNQRTTSSCGDSSRGSFACGDHHAVFDGGIKLARISLRPRLAAGMPSRWRGQRWLLTLPAFTASGDAIQANWSQDLAKLNDGSLGAAGNGSDASASSIGIQSNNTSIIYTFDTSINDRGYDITGIRTYAGWLTYSGSYDVRSNQGYQVDLTFVNGATLTLQKKTSWAWSTSGLSLPATLWTEVAFANGNGGVALNNNSGVVASGVKSITFSNFDVAVPGGPVAYREIAIDGVASVPEPGAMILVVSVL